MNKDFVEVANDSGTNNGSFDVVCKQNSGNERSTILTVSGGGISKTVAVKQAGGSYKNKTFVIALGNSLIECTCISDGTVSGTRTISLQANNIALADDVTKEGLLLTSNFFVGVQSVDGDTSVANNFASMQKIRIDLYDSLLTKTNVITGFSCLYFADDRGPLVYNLANVMAYPSKSISITGADFNLNIVFTDTTIEYWCLSSALFMNKQKGISGDLALITHSYTLEEHKLVFWRGVNTVNSGDGVQIVGNNIVPIAETIQHPYNCKEFVLNDAADYLNLYQFALQVLRYQDSPIPMSLNTTRNNKQFDFELHLYK
jgi:hypothetical protein